MTVGQSHGASVVTVEYAPKIPSCRSTSSLPPTASPVLLPIGGRTYARTIAALYATRVAALSGARSAGSVRCSRERWCWIACVTSIPVGHHSLRRRSWMITKSARRAR
ncbi:hypothetical protein [Microbacterium lacticum]